jgi:hypothetical protein
MMLRTFARRQLRKHPDLSSRPAAIRRLTTAIAHEKIHRAWYRRLAW